MGPNLRKLLLSLSIGSLLFAHTIYLVLLFRLGDAHMSWLLSGVFVSSTLLFCAMHPENRLSGRAGMNTSLIVNGFLVGYGIILATNMESPYSRAFSIIGYSLLLGTIVSIYGMSIRPGLKKNVKVLHILNITIGIALTVGTLYYLYIFFLFSEDGNGEIWKLFVPLVLYVISYVIQMLALIAQRKHIAYTGVVIQILMPVVQIILWLSIVAGEGQL